MPTPWNELPMVPMAYAVLELIDISGAMPRPIAGYGYLRQGYADNIIHYYPLRLNMSPS